IRSPPSAGDVQRPIRIWARVISRTYGRGSAEVAKSERRPPALDRRSARGYCPVAMHRRRWMIAGMWIAALGAMAAIYVLFEPDHDPLRVETGDAPIFRAGQDRAPSASRLALPVGEDEASPALARGGRRH